ASPSRAMAAKSHSPRQVRRPLLSFAKSSAGRVGGAANAVVAKLAVAAVVATVAVAVSVRATVLGEGAVGVAGAGIAWEAGAVPAKQTLWTVAVGAAQTLVSGPSRGALALLVTPRTAAAIGAGRAIRAVAGAGVAVGGDQVPVAAA